MFSSLFVYSIRSLFSKFFRPRHKLISSQTRDDNAEEKKKLAECGSSNNSQAGKE
jgi:hypothetical protein